MNSLFQLSEIRWCLLALCVLGFCAACSKGDGRPATHPTEGKVVVDGQPAEGVFLVFHPTSADAGEPWRSQGVSQSDGTFTLSTFRRGDGAPAGEYVVTVLWQAGEDEEGTSTGPDVLRDRYRNPKTSELRAIIQAGPNRLEPFQLTTK